MNQIGSWPGDWTAVVGAAVRRRREELGLSGSKLSDRTDELGLRVPRNTIANLENGRKASLPVHELVMLARGLEVSPAELLCPPGEGIPAAPGEVRDPVEVAQWVSGARPWMDSPGLKKYGTREQFAKETGNRSFQQRSTPLQFWIQHQQLLDGWHGWETRAAVSAQAIEAIDRGERPVQKLWGAEPNSRDSWESIHDEANRQARLMAERIFAHRERIKDSGWPMPPLYGPAEGVLRYRIPDDTPEDFLPLMDMDWGI